MQFCKWKCSFSNAKPNYYEFELQICSHSYSTTVGNIMHCVSGYIQTCLYMFNSLICLTARLEDREWDKLHILKGGGSFDRS